VSDGTGTATPTKSAFSRRCSVSIDIDAPPERVWGLLTDAADFPRWNSTVTGVDGRIALGERLAVRVPVSDRTFKVTVSEFVAPSRMVWSDGFAPMFRGVRVYTLEPRSEGTRFTMAETFSGLLVPMIGRTLPDFVPVFETYAADLKREAESA
jgi:uncharacterized protein YndB with AHSA1/START domain